MHDELKRHAIKDPAKVALLTADQLHRRTYAELDSSANTIARWFYHLGLRTGDTIALLLENRLEVVEIWWAARRAGLYYVPISTHLREGEIVHLLRDSGAKLLITSRRFAPSASGSLTRMEEEERPHHAVLDGAFGDFHIFDPLAWGGLPRVPASELCGRELIYSSGTTGKPKGVRRPLAPLTSDRDAPLMEKEIRRIFQCGRNMIYLAASPLYHSMGRFLMRAIEAGGTSIVMDRFDAAEALAAIERFRVTHTIWVPTMFVRMLALPEEVRRSHDLSSLQLALHAAAPCPVVVKEKMIEWFGPIVDEFYGGTENVGVTFISASEWQDHKGSVGRSIAGPIHILAEDGSGTELPVGATGLVYFEGGLSFAYHGDEAKTRSAFSSQGWGTYGDIGHVHHAGYLYLSDRRTDLIISGGINIYPSEVEHVLQEHPAIAEVAVIGLPEPEFGEKVVAIIRTEATFSPDEFLSNEIKEWARHRLAKPKCPRDIFFTDQLPTNEHGKLLKRVLRERYCSP